MPEAPGCLPPKIRSVLDLKKTIKNLKKSDIFIPYQGKYSTYDMKTVIGKSCPDRSVRNLLVTQFGLEPREFHKFSLDDKTIDKEIDILMPLLLVLETRGI